MKRLVTALVALFCVFAVVSSDAQEKFRKSVDSLILVKTPRTFNGSVIISRDGKQVYKRSYGFNDINKKILLKANDQFLIGSVSKQFTATLVLKEVEAGRIRLNNTIRTYLPDFSGSWADSVSVQQLLNHTSGIVGWDKNLASAPGTKFSYTNINYAILGKIVEKTSGHTYTQLTAGLFRSCGMTQSTVPPVSGVKKDLSRLVKGYSEDGNGGYQDENILDLLDSPPMGIPASGMISTAEDLSRWLNYLHTGKLLADSTYRMMIHDAVPRPHRWGEVKYGDGIQVSCPDGVLELSMSGYVPGFIATIIYYPAAKTSMVVLENISPSSTDMSRAFYFHDQIRQLVQRHLLKK